MITSGEQDIRTFNNGSILLRISAVILIAVSLKNEYESQNQAFKDWISADRQITQD